MPKINDQIAEVERKIEQNRNRLKDLKGQATKQDRKDDARRKLLYGAAYLTALPSLSTDAHRKALVDFEALRDLVGLDAIVGSMKQSLGDRLVSRTINRRMDVLNEGRKTGALMLGAGVGLTTQRSAASTPVAKNEFFGD